MDKFLWVGLGGALGAILRYSISLLPMKSSFPILTFITNLIGAFIIGMVVGLFEKHYLSSQLNLFLKTGVCGGFTTFSTFSLESMNLLSDGKFLMAGGYILLSVSLCLLFVYLGNLCVKVLL